MSQFQDNVPSYNPPHPAFEYQLGWSEDYESLFRGEFSEETDIAALITKTVSSGRTLLSARGGGAKTVILRRLLGDIVKAGIVPFFIDLKEWSSANYGDWEQLGQTETPRIAFLLERFSEPRTSISALDTLPADLEKLIIIDGLSEVIASIGDAIIEAVDELVRRIIKASVVVADRLIRRQLPHPERWRIATIMPLNESQIRRHLTEELGSPSLFDESDASKKLLFASPYYLGSILEEGTPTDFSSQIHEQYFQAHSNLLLSELDDSSRAAFNVYQKNKARSFFLSDFILDAGEAVVAKLVDSGAIVTAEDSAYFSHHLLHDYLASRYLAKSGKEKWTRDEFDVVSFNASSFDALSMVLEQVANTELADLFTRLLYDWNPYAAVYSLGEGRHTRAPGVSGEMEVVLLAIMAERRFDLIATTARRAEDALSLFGSDNSKPYLEARSLRDVFKLLNDFHSEETWFNDWRDLFSREKANAVNDKELEAIKDPESITGWSFSNVLKRLDLQKRQQEILVSMMPKVNATVRWRIVHVLGSYPSESNVQTLLASYDEDPDGWVKYGSIRSLIEMAALGDQRISELVFSEITQRVGKLSQDEATLREFERTIFLDPKRTPSHWVPLVLRVLETFRNSEILYEQRGHWESLAHRLSNG